MEAKTWQRAAAVGCVAMAALLSILQVALPVASRPPLALWALFTGLWVFGAVMLYAWPPFGAGGTVAWGALSGASFLRMHGITSLIDGAVILGTTIATVCAARFLIARREAR